MELKDYQQGVLAKFDHYLSTLRGQVKKIAAAQEVLKVQGLSIDLGDPCVKAWDQLNEERRLPYLKDEDGNDRVADYLRRLDGLQRSIPNVTLKVPTGGGKTLLATAAVERIQMDFFRRQTGFVLWWCRAMPFISRPGSSSPIASTLTAKCWSGRAVAA